ncbi:MAG TPA: ABC transporter substrate-binding protein [Casimicrobiaceae bacterium]|nr:ABC transporter substrate-binding protein [Casimicrobiaceae bacterium]
MTIRFRSALAAVCLSLAAFAASPACAATIRAVMNSDLKIVDPIWTTAYITRDHGYMIYDTLFATDANGNVQPQMVDRYTVSADGLVYTLTLRDGLLWHDGKPVTSDDCIASIRRWGAKDATGQKMMSFVKGFEAVDARTFRIVLSSPTGLVLLGLGKPSSLVPFMMPKRVADTSPDQQITDFTGSGPFVFAKDEWKPGDKAVYVKFDKYRPRSEPPSGLAGGKVVKVDRVEWQAIPDQQTAINALLAGEIDFIEQPAHDLLPLVEKDPNIAVVDINPLGNQYSMRFNSTAKPFDDPRVRQAVLYALNQEDFLKATVGNPKYYKVCKALFICGTPLASTKGMEGLFESNFARSKALLKEAGYDGTPIVLLHSTDLQVLANLGPVAKSLLERGGFRVDMQSMDWQSVVARRAKKDPPSQGGWHAMLTSWVSADVLNPVMTAFLNASCDKAAFGWPCDAQMEKLRDDFARETDPAKQKAIAEAVQARWIENPTHAILGQWYQPALMRRNLDGIVVSPVTVFWNMTKR